ncbi:MAG: hypothetical protein KC593_06095 [Myxococcales bacterium]|nr:hypothetical protein [Myxococcales bacterium]MCB9627280.1 hypothetical protein [Sandaracinaceae bacterium]
MTTPFTTLRARLLLGWALLATLLISSGPASAHAQDSQARVEGQSLVVVLPGGAEAVVALGCTPVDMRVRGDRAFVACAREVLVVRIGETAAALLSRHAVSAEAVRFVDVGAELWVETHRRAAEPVAELVAGSVPETHGERGTGVTPVPHSRSVPEPSPAHEASPAPEARGAVARGESVAVTPADGDSVVVALGADHGLEVGSRIELFVVREEDLGDGQLSAQEQRVAVGEVVSVGADRSRVRVGLGERVPADARARPTDRDLTRSLVAPPRIGGFVSTSVVLRALLAVQQLGLLAMADLRATYHGEQPYFLRAEVDPVGLSMVEGPNQAVFGARILAGYDHALFGVGLGVGAARVEDRFWVDDERVRYEVDAVAFTIDQYVRVGAVDGLNLEVTSGFALEHGIFRWARVRADVQIPVAHAVWLTLSGAGGHTGVVTGEIGVRYMARGDGAAGTLFILGSAGGGSFFYGPGHYEGAHVGFGFELRL